jgi:hypothetical protein
MRPIMVSLSQRLAWYSMHLGCFLTGPLLTGVLYVYMSMDMDASTLLYCKGINWQNNWDSRDGCIVDIAERLRCPSTRSVRLPPTLTNLLNVWTHVAVLVFGMGAVHIFIGIIMSTYEEEEIEGGIIGYITLLCVFGVVGTSSYYSSESPIAYAHFFITGLLVVLSYATTYIFMYYRKAEYRSQMSHIVQIFLTVSMLGLLSACIYYAVTPDRELAAGILSITEQLYLNAYALQMLLMIRTKYYHLVLNETNTVYIKLEKSSHLHSGLQSRNWTMLNRPIVH